MSKKLNQVMEDINDVLIFAVKRPGDSLAIEAKKVRKALNLLNAFKVKYTLAVGTYQGRHEIAICAFPGSKSKREMIAAHAFLTYFQDSILHLGTRQKDGSREAILEHSLLDCICQDIAHYERLGFWRAASPAQAASARGATYVPALDQNFIAA